MTCAAPASTPAGMGAGRLGGGRGVDATTLAELGPEAFGPLGRAEELDVEGGDGITAYLVRASDYAQFVRSRESFWGGSFLQYDAFGARGVRRHVARQTLDAGDYVLVVKEMSDPNILGAADTALTHVRVVATTWPQAGQGW
jgi:hypothetical protein